MTFEIALVFAIIVLALVIFALELFSVDFAAFGIMALFLALASAHILPLDMQDVLSGFSNPATITVLAILIPMVISLAREKKRASSKLLIPLSYTSQLAGVITLIGTSTNILASSLAQKLELGAFGMFEFSKIGLMIFATGVLYLLLIGRHLVPNHRTEERLYRPPDSCRTKTALSESVEGRGA